MLMTALAWNLKAWWALMLPVSPGRWQEKHTEEKQWVLGLEFKTFLNAFVQLPCQIIRTGRKIIYRLLGGNPYLSIFFRLIGALRCNFSITPRQQRAHATPAGPVVQQ